MLLMAFLDQAERRWSLPFSGVAILMWKYVLGNFYFPFYKLNATSSCRKLEIILQGYRKRFFCRNWHKWDPGLPGPGCSGPRERNLEQPECARTHARAPSDPGTESHLSAFDPSGEDTRAAHTDRCPPAPCPDTAAAVPCEHCSCPVPKTLLCML